MIRTIGLMVFALVVTATATRAEEPANPPTYKLPKGWEQLKPNKSVVPAIYFRAGESGVAVTLISLGGDGGGLVANVNRWRAQIGLKELDAKDALNSLEAVKVDGTAAHLLDVTGQADGDKPGQRVVAIVVKSGDTTWFVKMGGAGEAVGKQRPAFDEFVKSIKFAK